MAGVLLQKILHPLVIDFQIGNLPHIPTDYWPRKQKWFHNMPKTKQ